LLLGHVVEFVTRPELFLLFLVAHRRYHCSRRRGDWGAMRCELGFLSAMWVRFELVCTPFHPGPVASFGSSRTRSSYLRKRAPVFFFFGSAF
jgi:hypothetical protein